jgi:hypothetical protein
MEAGENVYSSEILFCESKGEGWAANVARMRRNHLKDLREYGRVIFKMILNNMECMSWIFLARNRVQWRAVLNTVMKVRVVQKRGFAN